MKLLHINYYECIFTSPKAKQGCISHVVPLPTRQTLNLPGGKISPTCTNPFLQEMHPSQYVALPLVSFSTSVLQRCRQPSRTESSSSVMCLGAGCMGRSGGIRDCVNGLWITDLWTGDVLGTSDDEGPCCSIVLRSFKTWSVKIESSHRQTKSYTIKIRFSSENGCFKGNNFLKCNLKQVTTIGTWN